MHATFPLWVYPLLFITGLIAGLVDSIAGGGGIISLPLLLNLGMPPAQALGTNKLQACFGSVTASVHYARGGIIEWSHALPGIAATLVGATIGSLIVAHIPSALLQQIIPWLLVAIVTYTIVRPEIGLLDRAPRWRQTPFFLLLGLTLGFYDGAFGPGTGSFWTMALVAGLGYNFMKATGTTKIMNATSNVTSLAVLAIAGKVAYLPGIIMGLGQLVGARLGARLVLRNGARFVRPIFILMAIATVSRLLYLNLLKT